MGTLPQAHFFQKKGPHISGSPPGTAGGLEGGSPLSKNNFIYGMIFPNINLEYVSEKVKSVHPLSDKVFERLGL